MSEKILGLVQIFGVIAVIGLFAFCLYNSRELDLHKPTSSYLIVPPSYK